MSKQRHATPRCAHHVLNPARDTARPSGQQERRYDSKHHSRDDRARTFRPKTCTWSHSFRRTGSAAASVMIEVVRQRGTKRQGEAPQKRERPGPGRRGFKLRNLKNCKTCGNLKKSPRPRAGAPLASVAPRLAAWCPVLRVTRISVRVDATMTYVVVVVRRCCAVDAP